MIVEGFNFGYFPNAAESLKPKTQKASHHHTILMTQLLARGSIQTLILARCIL